MESRYAVYRSLNYTLPAQSWAWNLYGAGLDQMGRDGAPEPFEVPTPTADQLLVRIDSVGVCYSDVKIVNQGGSHPKLYNRDLKNDPTRLGHEVALTVIAAGENLRNAYYPGQRLAVQPDIYQQGRSTAYGYTTPGGLAQYHLIGREVLETDAGACLLPVADEMGYAESALLEPWGCVVAAYTQRRRLEPKPGGRMWIAGRPGDRTEFTFTKGLEAPAVILLSDVPDSVRNLAHRSGAQVVEHNRLVDADIEALSRDYTDGAGFDDIILLNPVSARRVGQIARQIARRGTCNLAGSEPLDGLVEVDLGRLHYDYLAFLGTRTTDIAASYGEARNRCELRPGGTAVMIGAGGPMGQMHLQRALELHGGPRRIIATEIDRTRLETLETLFGSLAAKQGRELHFFNPADTAETFHDLVMRLTDGRGADDVVVCVPVARLMEEGAAVMSPDGMLVLFAGVPNGTMGAVNLSNVYLANAQYTGTSGLTIADQASVMARRLDGSLSPGRSVAAVAGLDAAAEAIRAVKDGVYPGKVVIFPQIRELPLTGLQELKEAHPEIADKLGEEDTWTRAAEAALIEKFWAPGG